MLNKVIKVSTEANQRWTRWNTLYIKVCQLSCPPFVDIPELVVLETRQGRNLSINTVYFIQCQPSWDDDTDLYSQLVKFALLYALPLLFISVTYYQIVRVLWRSARLAIVNRSNTGNTDDESASHNGTGSDFFIITFLTLSILNQSRLVSLFDADSLTSKSIFSRRLGSWQILIFLTKISQCLLSHLCYFWRRRNFSLQLYKNFQLEPFFLGNLFPVMTTISLLPKDLNDLYI